MKSKNAGATICMAILISLPASAQNQETANQAESPDTAHLIESIEGPVLFQAYCATCHGTDGKGSGPMSQWLKLKTPDLTGISIRGGGKFSLARVQRIISGEENIKRGHGTREMPVWGPIFSQVSRDQDLGRMRVYNLAKFIEKIQR